MKNWLVFLKYFAQILLIGVFWSSLCGLMIANFEKLNPVFGAIIIMCGSILSIMLLKRIRKKKDNDSH